MRVIISAGGTGGHIYPALAIINKIKEMEPSSEFLYIGTHNRMEKDIVPKQNINFKALEIYGFNRKKLLKNFKVIKCLFKSYNQCRKIMKDFKPDIVIGVGGYVTAPVIMSANKLGIKTIIHEQNSVPGLTNIKLSKIVDKVLVSFKSSINAFPSSKTIYTGNPCSDASKLVEEIKKDTIGLSKDKKLVLFVMGSLGSSKMNQVLVDNMHKFKNKDYEVLFVTGKDNYEDISKIKFPANVKVVPYVDGLPKVMKCSDLMVTRSGASTLSELIALKVPALLIPSPNVTNNHQYKNAMDLVNGKAAILLEEKNLTEDNLVNTIDEILNDKKLLIDIKSNLNLFDIQNSSQLIYDEIKKTLGDK